MANNSLFMLAIKELFFIFALPSNNNTKVNKSKTPVNSKYILKNKIMKTTINKSEIMKRAWAIYRFENSTPRFGWGRGRKYEFRFALIRAWKEARIAANRPIDTSVTSRPANMSPAFAAGCADYYGTNNRYYGD